MVFGFAFCACFLVSIISYAYPTPLFVEFSSGTSRCNEEACLFWRACVPYGESVTAYSDVFSYMCLLQREIRRISLQLNDNCVSLKVDTLQGRLTKLEQDCRSERVLSYGDCSLHDVVMRVFKTGVKTQEVLHDSKTHIECLRKHLYETFYQVRSSQCEASAWNTVECEVHRLKSFECLRSSLQTLLRIEELRRDITELQSHPDYGTERPFDKIMIVAHADDESIFGGLHLLEEKGWLVICVACNEIFYDGNAQRLRRRDEFLAVSQAAAFCPVMLGYRNGYSFDIQEQFDVACEILQILQLNVRDHTIKLIVTHDAGEFQGDYPHEFHILVKQAVIQMMSSKSDLAHTLHVFARSSDHMGASKLASKLALLEPYSNGTQTDAVVERINTVIPYEGLRKMHLNLSSQSLSCG